MVVLELGVEVLAAVVELVVSLLVELVVELCEVEADVDWGPDTQYASPSIRLEQSV